jgi:group I intron endonuclease
VEDFGYIYRWTNLVNGKVYIGQTRQTPEERKRGYFFENSKRLIILAMKKYGQRNFQFEVLEKCTLEELDDKEIDYIALHNATNKMCGYNVTFWWSKETSNSDATIHTRY